MGTEETSPAAARLPVGKLYICDIRAEEKYP